MHPNNNALQSYINQINRFPLITPNEEKELAEQIANGNEEARTKLIVSNLRLVVKIAYDFKGLGLPILDLISEGNIGLIKAVEKFDPKRGAKFSSYAAWWIKQGMRRSLSDQTRMVRIPRQALNKINQIIAAQTKLEEASNQYPTNKEIAQMTQLAPQTIVRFKPSVILNIRIPVETKDDFLENDQWHNIFPAIQTDTTPKQEIEDREDQKMALEILNRLNEREKLVLTLRFGLNNHRPTTLANISRIINRTRERVRQIQIQALKKLKKMIENNDPTVA